MLTRPTSARSWRKTAQIWLAALRPRQWTKNGLVFGGLVFSLNLDKPELVARVLLAFLVLCVLASSGYLVNDTLDAPQDRLHPAKARRPIAAGLIAPRHAILVASGLFLLALPIAAWLGGGFLLLGLGYVGLTAAYSLWLKHYALLDVFVIAVGFVLRAAAGAVVIGVMISPWLLLCTLLGALLIALGKRRSELASLEATAPSHRSSLAALTVEFLDELMLIMAAASIMAYSLYTFSERPGHPPLLMLTIPLVIYGIFRYLYLVRIAGLGGSPEEVLLGDPPLLGTVVLWGLLSLGILYLAPR
ncbi:MAG TPA: decaprenyl-phosphate phosphoribosyltransferase [Chloroflexota bacterium]|nr:decaprenyl-phosphate phosphoribosyltransferase [Chloroflexota bacterium]